MNKIISINSLSGYCLDSCTQKKEMIKQIEGFDELLEDEVERLKNRLAELQEIQHMNDDIVYLIKSTDSEFNYVDKNKNVYEYKIIQDKPMLISDSFEVYEIIEYADVKEFRKKDKYSGRSWLIEAYVDKVCKVKKVK